MKLKSNICGEHIVAMISSISAVLELQVSMKMPKGNVRKSLVVGKCCSLRGRPAFSFCRQFRIKRGKDDACENLGLSKVMNIGD